VLPNLPTIAEAGVKDFESTWYIAAAPSKVPVPTVHKLNADVNAIISAPEFQPRLHELGVTLMGGNARSGVRKMEQSYQVREHSC
jgi:tripartite-type tricarboxylate transporter receptor subunit TctC